MVYGWYRWRNPDAVAFPAPGLFPDLLAIDPKLEPESFPAGVESPKQWPRGIRNNNPGNIRYTGAKWMGLSDPASDGEYCRFTNVRYGIRAMARILKSYRARGLDSIDEIIGTWAPDSENNTFAYVVSVSQRMGFAAELPLSVEQWPELIESIIYHENGVQAYSIKIIEEGVALA